LVASDRSASEKVQGIERYQSVCSAYDFLLAREGILSKTAHGCNSNVGEYSQKLCLGTWCDTCP